MSLLNRNLAQEDRAQSPKEFFSLPLIRKVLPAALLAIAATIASSQSPTIVQPGAPGQPSKTLTPATANAAARAPSPADVEFMQGMIMHHGQAVQMTELLRTRSHDTAVQALGKRITISQTDEMRFMKQWLSERGLSTSMPGMDNMAEMDHSKMDHSQMDHSKMDHGKMDHMSMDHSKMDMPMMPGMLTQHQMDALAAADGPAFDQLFLTGMIQHHTGALTMVKQLFATQGAAQDAQLFDFANDVDNTQQAEIDIMRGILKEKQ